MYEEGKKVYWESQAGGVKKRKTGQIVAVVPPNAKPLSVVIQKRLRMSHKIATMGQNSAPRNHESYLVSVSGEKEGTLPSLYCPRVKDLRPADD